MLRINILSIYPQNSLYQTVLKYGKLKLKESKCSQIKSFVYIILKNIQKLENLPMSWPILFLTLNINEFSRVVRNCGFCGVKTLPNNINAKKEK